MVRGERGVAGGGREPEAGAGERAVEQRGAGGRVVLVLRGLCAERREGAGRVHLGDAVRRGVEEHRERVGEPLADVGEQGERRVRRPRDPVRADLERQLAGGGVGVLVGDAPPQRVGAVGGRDERRAGDVGRQPVPQRIGPAERRVEREQAPARERVRDRRRHRRDHAVERGRVARQVRRPAAQRAIDLDLPRARVDGADRQPDRAEPRRHVDADDPDHGAIGSSAFAWMTSRNGPSRARSRRLLSSSSAYSPKRRSIPWFHS